MSEADRDRIIGLVMGNWIANVIKRRPKHRAPVGFIWRYVIKTERWCEYPEDAEPPFESVKFDNEIPSPIIVDVKLSHHALTQWVQGT